jgi:RNA polymerase-binding transcription factor
MDPERARELLARERERIERALASLNQDEAQALADEDEPGELDSEGLYQDEFDAGTAQDLADQLAALVRAEARLAAGTYGLSVESGKPIPDERLEIVPTAELTVEEQAIRDSGRPGA